MELRMERIAIGACFGFGYSSGDSWGAADVAADFSLESPPFRIADFWSITVVSSLKAGFGLESSTWLRGI
jgi:hypothetical protein